MQLNQPKLMIPSFGKPTLVVITAALILTASARILAEEPAVTNSPSTPSAPVAPMKSRTIPFHGKLASVDKVAKTILLEGPAKRVIEITSQTRIMKNGKPATLEDAVAGDNVAGSYLKSADGKLSAKMVRFGAKKEPTTEPAPANPTDSK
jgi:hypothetical protein